MLNKLYGKNIKDKSFFRVQFSLYFSTTKEIISLLNLIQVHFHLLIIYQNYFSSNKTIEDTIIK